MAPHPAGGKDELEVKSATLVFGSTQAREFAQPVPGKAGSFNLNIPGVGQALTLKAAIAGKDGSGCSGAVLIRPRAIR